MIRGVFLALTISTLISCDSNLFYSEYRSLEEPWNPDEALHFNLPEADSTALYNIFINLRNTNEYPFSNLFLIADIHFPNGKIITDTLEYEMARPDGSWLGKGQNVKDNKLWYKENIQFFEPGSYAIEIKHAMRQINQVEGVSLKGVTDVGISVEIAEPNQ